MKRLLRILFDHEAFEGVTWSDKDGWCATCARRLYCAFKAAKGRGLAS